jgi:hypothetical protein
MTSSPSHEISTFATVIPVTDSDFEMASNRVLDMVRCLSKDSVYVSICVISLVMTIDLESVSHSFVLTLSVSRRFIDARRANDSVLDIVSISGRNAVLRSGWCWG